MKNKKSMRQRRNSSNSKFLIKIYFLNRSEDKFKDEEKNLREKDL